MKYRLAVYLLLLTQWSFSQYQKIDEVLLDYTTFYHDTDDLLSNINRSKGKIIEYHIGGLVLLLEPQNTISDSYKSIDSKGIVSNGPPLNISTLTGFTINGDKASVTVGEGFIYGVINSHGGQYFIEPRTFYISDASPDEYIIYHSSSVNLNVSPACGAFKQQEAEEAVQPYFKKLSEGLCYTVDYGIVHDHSMVTKYGSAALAEAFAIGVTNAVNTNYDDEFSDEVLIQVTGQYSIDCMGCEPWAISTDPNIILSNFTNWANQHLDENPININHDVASLWTDIDLNGNVVGVAYLGGTCYNTRYNVLQDFQGSPEEKQVLLAHELGHNFNALHDPTGSNYIMAPTITVTDQWSQYSKLRIEAFYKDSPCLDICPGETPQVNFYRDEIHVMETGVEVGASCSNTYTLLNAGIEISHMVDDSVVVVLEVDPSSTATSGNDYLFSFDTITYYGNGPLTQFIPIKILDDKVPENEEFITFNVSIHQGLAEVGSGSVMDVVIHNVRDEVSTICCSDGPETTYGSSDYQFNGIFYGTQDARSRTLLRSEDLQSYGLTSGYIDQLSVYVALKNSYGSYDNFRIGMKQVNLVELGQTWYNTTEVFRGDVNTVQGKWNDFSFHTPFYWDGSSDIYIDFCFDNRKGVGRDYILAWDASNQGYDLFSFRAFNYTDGCELTSGTFFYHEDRNPYLKFRKVTGVVWETAVTSPETAIVKAGDTAHFYSENEKIVASIHNLGSEDLGCTELQIHEQGNGRYFLPNSAYHYSHKNYLINVDNDHAYYELTLYFTSDELNIWAADMEDLAMIQSEGEIQLGNSTTRNYGIYQLLQGQGMGFDFKVVATIKGSGYLALTDQPQPPGDFIVESGNYVIEDSGSGMILNSSGGAPYNLFPSAGQISSVEYDQSSPGNLLVDGDLIFSESGAGIFFHSSGNNYHSIGVNNVGGVILSENVPAPIHSINIPQGHLSLGTEGKGVVFRVDHETCWKMVVEESGHLLTFKIKCPN